MEAAIALAAGYAAGAVKHAESFQVFKRGLPSLTYLSARAHLVDGQTTEALSDWNRLAAISVSGFWKTVATVGRARTSARAGDAAAARAAYDDVLSVWKATDADLPLLAEVKSEYAKLK